MVGATVGALIGEAFLIPVNPHVRNVFDARDRRTRVMEYGPLRQNEEAKKLLSPLGKFSLAVWTWSPSWLPVGLASSDEGLSTCGEQGVEAAFGELRSVKESFANQLSNTFTFGARFEKEELDGLDVGPDGRRIYLDDLKDRDVEALQHRLDHLQELKKNAMLEARYAWQVLAKKERTFYDLVEENDEKDLYQREIILLNNVTPELLLREAVFAYYIADARKQLAQLQHNGSTPLAARTLSDPLQSEILIERDDKISPQFMTSKIRANWMLQKNALATFEERISKRDTTNPHRDVNAQADAFLRQIAVSIMKNIQACEGLLSEFEEQVRKAEENGLK